MIPRATIERILDATKIEEVIGDFLTLKRRGTSFVACCPFHNEKTPSFHVTPSRGIFKCFGCGKGGTAVSFLMEHQGFTYPEALKYLAKKYHIEVEEREESAEEIAVRQKGESLLLVVDFAQKFFAQQLHTEQGQVGYAYFRSRGLTDETIEKYGLGWAPAGKDTLFKAAREAGYKQEYIVDANLCMQSEEGEIRDRFYNRVVFPIRNITGRTVAFGCRTLSNEKTVAKYINSSETEIYQKRKTLYGMSEARNAVHKLDNFILVEGYLDVLTLHQLGIMNVAASSGTALTSEQIDIIQRCTNNVTIIYDGDSAGIHAALRGIGMFLEKGMKVKIVLLPDGEDPDSFGRSHSKEEVEDYIAKNAKDFIGFKLELMLDEAGSDPLRRAELINDIADTISLIPDAIIRAEYARYAGMKLNVSEDLLHKRISKTRKERYRELTRQRERAEEITSPVPSEEAPFPQETIELIPRADNNIENDPLLAPCEKELLRFILLSGEEDLIFPPDSPCYSPDITPKVADFIDATLADDDVYFSNTVYRNIYEEYMTLRAQNLNPSQIIVRLLSDQDPTTVEATRSLIEEKHQITVKSFEKSLTNEVTTLAHFVPRTLLVYSMERLEKESMELNKLLADKSSDEEATSRIMLRKLEVLRLRNAIKQKLGRV